MLSTDIAMDLGSYAIKIFENKKGIVVNEPYIAAIQNNADHVVEIGEKAYDMLGRTSDRIRLQRPLKNGVICDLDLSQYLVNRYIKKIGGNRVLRPRVVVNIPSELTEVEKMAVVNSVISAGVRKISLIQKPIAAAIGAGVNINSPHGSLIVDIGAGTTDMAVVSVNGISNSKTLKIGGYSFDEAIIKFIKSQFGIIIADRMAEECKKNIGGVMQREGEPAVFTIKGKSVESGLPLWTDVTSNDLILPMVDVADNIITALQEMTEDTDPELLSDVYADGMIVTGGSANLYGIDKLIEKRLGIPVVIAENPELSVALGAGKALEYLDNSDKNEYGFVNPLIAAY